MNCKQIDEYISYNWYKDYNIHKKKKYAPPPPYPTQSLHLRLLVIVRARGDGSKVPPVSLGRARGVFIVFTSLENLNVRQLRHDRGRALDVVLVAHGRVRGEDGNRRRKRGDQIILVNDTVRLTLVRLTHEARNLVVTDLGRTVRVQVGVNALAAEVSGGERSHGTTEGVARHYNLVFRPFSLRRCNRFRNRILTLFPGTVEATVDLAA
jgi:hypothetical protein